jgi:hypothetical protein
MTDALEAVIPCYWFLAQLRSFGFSALRFPRLPQVTSPVSSHSIDFPNSRLIFSRICAPVSVSPVLYTRKVSLAHANPRRELRLRYVEHSFGAAKLKLLGAIVLLAGEQPLEVFGPFFFV